jgi:hypothetical protein
MTTLELLDSPQVGSFAEARYADRMDFRVPVVVEWLDPTTHQRCHMPTWLFSCSEYGASFNSERIPFSEGMVVTLVSHSKFQVEAIVKWVKQYSISAH